MKKQIPVALIYTRLILGPMIVCLSFIQIEHYSTYAIVLLTIGLLTDIFDGIIARQLNVSSQKLRRLDSSVDQVFFICVAIATFIQCPAFFKEHSVKLMILLSFEGLAYLLCYLKFRKEIATHSIGAKIWTLVLFATLIQVIWQCQAPLLFPTCFWLGVLSRVEIIGIILALKTWTNDVPTLYHAIRLRKNKEIRRHKIFNG